MFVRVEINHIDGKGATAILNARVDNRIAGREVGDERAGAVGTVGEGESQDFGFHGFIGVGGDVDLVRFRLHTLASGLVGMRGGGRKGRGRQRLTG